MMIRRIAFCIMLALATWSQASPLRAQGEIYTVLVQDYEALPPYSTYVDGTDGGFNRELLDLFATKQGYTFDYVALPVKRLFVEFASGVGDLKYPDNPNWALQIKKDAEIVYSEPVVEYVNGVMVRPADQGAGIDRIRKLGLVAGWTPLGFQEQIESGTIELVENNSYDGLLKQAILGRIDGAYSNVATSRYYLNNTLDEPDGLVFDEGLPHVRNARRLSSIHHPDIIAEFDRFLQESADEIAALKQHYAVEDGVLVN